MIYKMEKIIKQLNTVWFILGFIVVVTIWYANVNSRLNAIETKQQEDESALVQLMTLKTDVAVIKADVSWIKERLR